MYRLARGEKFVGIRQSTRAVIENKVKIAYIARDAEMYVVFRFEEICKEKKINIIYADNMRELAKACEVDVPTSVAVLLS
ncbi:MAG: ribosomal L7Ae/L30e/S12e/Gadd45 family protein [Clostridiales bacterium]|jgi:large subunit ribosomal protein L7A|nr:ribosomal L7Ae/L30e/S12e/Gadd45 family protein [Clostridiales bacterium]